jgi:hypothetical protein
MEIDSVVSASILSKAFQREYLGHQITSLPQINLKTIQNIASVITDSNQFAIFLDFGSKLIDTINEVLPLNQFLILDHHDLNSSSTSSQINHLNPFLCNIDNINTINQISCSGISYLFAQSLNPKNIDLHFFAILGALSEGQNSGNKKIFQGINKTFLDLAENDGKIQTEVNIAISRFQPLDEALANTLPLEIPPISNNLSEAQKFLKQNNIKIVDDLNDPRNLQDLSKREQQALTNNIVMLANEIPGTEFAILLKKIIHTNYIFTDFGEKEIIADGYELLKIMQKCIVNNRIDTVIAFLLGDKEAKKEALEIFEK